MLIYFDDIFVYVGTYFDGRFRQVFSLGYIINGISFRSRIIYGKLKKTPD